MAGEHALKEGAQAGSPPLPSDMHEAVPGLPWSLYRPLYARYHCYHHNTHFLPRALPGSGPGILVR